MSSHPFVTVDVFAQRAFEGNQLAVFPDARGIPEELMLRIAREFGFSETTFVLPPERGGDARVRIYTLEDEAAFAGHPLVGTATVLAEQRGVDRLLLEVPAGDCAVTVKTAAGVRSARVTTPQPFTIDGTVPVDLVAPALSLGDTDLITGTHPPTVCGLGRAFVVVEVAPAAVDAITPDAHAFARAREALNTDRFAVLAYARESDSQVGARMFAPLAGTVEDAATGSANVALVGLLLHHADDAEEVRLTSRQGVRMGRPSTLHLHAWRAGESIRASVAGAVVPVTTGSLTLP